MNISPIKLPASPSPPSRRWGRYDILCLVCMAVVLCLAIVRPFYTSIFFGDESYQALCVRHYDISPLAMYTFWKGYLWTILFGDNYISLRLLSLIITFLSLAISTTYLGRKAHSWRMGGWMFVLCGLLACYEGNIMYNWDTAPTILYVVGAIFTLEYYATKNIKYALGLGVVIALLAMSRIQLVALVPPAMIFITISGRSWRPLLAFTLAAVGTGIVFSIVMIGGPKAYFSSFTTENIITGHSLSDYRRSITLVLYNLDSLLRHTFISFIVVPTGLWLSVGGASRLKYVMVALPLVILGVCQGIEICNAGWIDIGFNSAGLPISLFLVLLPPMCNCTKREYFSSTITVSMVLLAIWLIIPAIGSDVMVMRLNAAPLIPLMMVPMLGAPKVIKNVIRNVCIASFIAFGTSVVTKTVIETSIMTESLNNLPLHNHLYGTKTYVQEYTKIYNLTLSAKEVNPNLRINFDSSRYGYCYTLQSGPTPYLHKFHMLDMESDVATISRAAQNYDVWIAVGVTSEGYQPWEDALFRLGYVRVYDEFDTALTDTDTPLYGNIMYIREPYATIWLDNLKKSYIDK